MLSDIKGTITSSVSKLIVICENNTKETQVKEILTLAVLLSLSLSLPSLSLSLSLSPSLSLSLFIYIFKRSKLLPLLYGSKGFVKAIENVSTAIHVHTCTECNRKV